MFYTANILLSPLCFYDPSRPRARIVRLTAKGTKLMEKHERVGGQREGGVVCDGVWCGVVCDVW